MSGSQGPGATVGTPEAAQRAWLAYVAASKPGEQEESEQEENEGSRPQLGKPGSGKATDPATKAEALARHELLRQRVYGWLLAGASGQLAPTASEADVLWKNSCEWALAPGVEVRVQSAVDRPYQEARTDVEPSETAYFDARQTIEESGADYDRDIMAPDPGLDVVGTGVGGSNDRGTINLYVDQSLTKERLKPVLAHEVGHSADQHRGRWESPAEDWQYGQYRTEFTAYWIDGRFANIPTHGPTVPILLSSPETRTFKFAFTKNPRQEAILDLMLSSGYDWLEPLLYNDPAFRRFVRDFSKAETGNAVNSIRIQQLSDALADGGDVIMRAARALDTNDRAALADLVVARPFWDQVDRDTPELHDDLYDVITRSHVVVAGESLSRIAARLVGEAKAWRDIWEKNGDEIEDPNRIHPGQLIYLP